MKVFEVKTKYENEDGVVDRVQYIVQTNDDILEVTRYFQQECIETEQELISVRYVLTVSQEVGNHDRHQ